MEDVPRKHRVPPYRCSPIWQRHTAQDRIVKGSSPFTCTSRPFSETGATLLTGAGDPAPSQEMVGDPKCPKTACNRTGLP